MTPSGPPVRGNDSVSADVDKLLGPKSLEQLFIIERQVNAKLRSDEPIDVEYWEQLLENIGVYKAKAQLRNIYQSVIDSRLQGLKSQQIREAKAVQEKLAKLYHGKSLSSQSATTRIIYSQDLDPEPLLKVNAADKTLELVEESDFLERIVSCLSYRHDNPESSDKAPECRTCQGAEDELRTSTTAKARLAGTFVRSSRISVQHFD